MSDSELPPPGGAVAGQAERAGRRAASSSRDDGRGRGRNAAGVSVTAACALRGVSIVYPDGEGARTVLSGLDLDLAPGSITGFMCPSGCGKSSLLNILAGLQRPTAGTVELFGERLDYARPQRIAAIRRESVGVVAQNYGLIGDEDVFANVTLPLLFERPRRSRDERTHRAREALARVGLDVTLGRRLNRLSGGEQQRVAVARAIITGPRLVVADEPTAALDEETAEGITRLLRSLADDGVTVAVATHDPRVAALCHEVHDFEGARLVRRP